MPCLNKDFLGKIKGFNNPDGIFSVFDYAYHEFELSVWKKIEENFNGNNNITELRLIRPSAETAENFSRILTSNTTCKKLALYEVTVPAAIKFQPILTKPDSAIVELRLVRVSEKVVKIIGSCFRQCKMSGLALGKLTPRSASNIMAFLFNDSVFTKLELFDMNLDSIKNIIKAFKETPRNPLKHLFLDNLSDESVKEIINNFESAFSDTTLLSVNNLSRRATELIQNFHGGLSDCRKQSLVLRGSVTLADEIIKNVATAEELSTVTTVTLPPHSSYYPMVQIARTPYEGQGKILDYLVKKYSMFFNNIIPDVNTATRGCIIMSSATKHSMLLTPYFYYSYWQSPFFDKNEIFADYEALWEVVKEYQRIFWNSDLLVSDDPQQCCVKMPVSVIEEIMAAIARFLQSDYAKMSIVNVPLPVIDRQSCLPPVPSPIVPLTFPSSTAQIFEELAMVDQQAAAALPRPMQFSFSLPLIESMTMNEVTEQQPFSYPMTEFVESHWDNKKVGHFTMWHPDNKRQKIEPEQLLSAVELAQDSSPPQQHQLQFNPVATTTTTTTTTRQRNKY
ncbi:MAG TPA: hypothetical protein VHZ76_07455 [Gammaproteobacteria bacterium]|jgi:hypothetical protein|nr:hypothetical protein [Gammaproteobacteria bacterium]